MPFEPPPFEVRLESRGPMRILAFGGELDLASVDVADHALSEALADGSGTVVVDLQNLLFMDSTGFHCLARAARRADEAGRRLALLNGSGPAHRLLELTCADQILETVDDLDQLGEPLA